MLLTKSNSDPLFTENEKLLDTNLTFKIDPPSLIPGVQVEVNLLCTFRRNEFPDMASVFSMIIAHSTNPTLPVYNYIASVNQVEGHAHNISHDIKIISGSVDNNGESSLHVRFNYPEINLTGAYMCEVYGFDQIGKPMTKYNSQILLTNNITDVYSLVRQNQELVSSIQACIQNQTGLVRPTRLLSVLLSNFYPPVINNGHAYYLTKNLTYFEYFSAQRVCEEFGGYLVELDDHQEFIFVRDFISSFHFSDAV
uniref:C-type lectin domain-containing protein n=1 Tax=Biomphalaria glabrata TaxID=6526 RepID=A0A2C9M2R4_BIOGL